MLSCKFCETSKNTFSTITSGRLLLKAIIRFVEFSNYNIPQVVGATGGAVGPTINVNVDYFNRKQHYSINSQATIGANLVFLDLAAGVPGGVHDSRVLRHSILYRNAERILGMFTETVQDIVIRPILLGDGGYPLTPWLITPKKSRINHYHYAV